MAEFCRSLSTPPQEPIDPEIRVLKPQVCMPVFDCSFFRLTIQVSLFSINFVDVNILLLPLPGDASRQKDNLSASHDKGASLFSFYLLLRTSQLECRTQLRPDQNVNVRTGFVCSDD
jgi:hypothetical protein